MKRVFLTSLFVIFLLSVSFIRIHAQNAGTFKQPLVSCMDIGLGYVPDKDWKALRGSVSFNNIFLHRFGLFTAIEGNKNKDYFSNIIGLTGSIINAIYLYAGMDFLTRNGAFGDAGFKSARKNFGIGVYPFPWAVVKAGYSIDMGITAEIGIKISLNQNR
jgi:hypothetical protein